MLFFQLRFRIGRESSVGGDESEAIYGFWSNAIEEVRFNVPQSYDVSGHEQEEEAWSEQTERQGVREQGRMEGELLDHREGLLQLPGRPGEI